MATSGQIDPKIWHFNPDTGEYHRITGWHKGQVFVDQRTYALRLAEEYEQTKHRRAVYITLPILGLISLFGWVGLTHSPSTAPFGLLALLVAPLLFVGTF